jgi:hypothetical protein
MKITIFYKNLSFNGLFIGFKLYEGGIKGKKPLAFLVFSRRIIDRWI